MQGREKAEFKRTRFLWLTNSENLERDERTRLSALLRLNSPIVKAYLLKEDLRRFCRSSAGVEGHLRQWLWRAAHSRLAPFKKFARMLRSHLDGVLPWTRIRVTSGALEGMNSKVKIISHRAYGYRTSWTYIADIHYCCAELPLPRHFWETSHFFFDENSCGRTGPARSFTPCRVPSLKTQALTRSFLRRNVA